MYPGWFVATCAECGDGLMMSFRSERARDVFAAEHVDLTGHPMRFGEVTGGDTAVDVLVITWVAG